MRSLRQEFKGVGTMLFYTVSMTVIVVQAILFFMFLQPHNLFIGVGVLFIVSIVEGISEHKKRAASDETIRQYKLKHGRK